MGSLLVVKNLNIEFHDHDAPEQVVKKLNLELAQGEILGIVGVRIGQIYDSNGNRWTFTPS